MLYNRTVQIHTQPLSLISPAHLNSSLVVRIRLRDKVLPLELLDKGLNEFIGINESKSQTEKYLLMFINLSLRSECPLTSPNLSFSKNYTILKSVSMALSNG